MENDLNYDNDVQSTPNIPMNVKVLTGSLERSNSKEEEMVTVVSSDMNTVNSVNQFSSEENKTEIELEERFNNVLNQNNEIACADEIEDIKIKENTIQQSSDVSQYDQNTETEQTQSDKNETLKEECTGNDNEKETEIQEFSIEVQNSETKITSRRAQLMYLLTISNILFLLFDVCLPTWDMISDFWILGKYWSRSNFEWEGKTHQMRQKWDTYSNYSITTFSEPQMYAVGFTGSVLILLLPSVSHMVDLFLKNDYSLKKMIIAFFYQFSMVWKGLKCFLNPENLEMKRNFQSLKVYEISLESTLQFILQTGVILFELFYRKPITWTRGNIITANDRKLEIISIATSIIAINYGYSSYTVNQSHQLPQITNKVRLMLRSFVDIILRFGILVSLIIYSLEWKYGVLISTSILSFLFVVIPSMAVFCNRCSKYKSSLAERSNLIIPVPIAHDKEKDDLRRIRIQNKFSSYIFSIIILVFQFLAINGNISIPKTDFWWDCYYRSYEIESLLKICWIVIIICMCLSSVEVFQYYLTKTSWIEFMYSETIEDKGQNVQQNSTITTPFQSENKKRIFAIQNFFVSLKRFVTVEIIIDIIIGVIFVSVFVASLEITVRPEAIETKNFTSNKLQEFEYEIQEALERKEDICARLHYRTQSEVLTAINEFIIQRKTEIVNPMIKCKYTYTTNLSGKTVIDTAVSECKSANATDECLSVIDSLVDAYPDDINIRDNNGFSPVYYASYEYNDGKILQRLTKNGTIPVRFTGFDGGNILYYSIFSGYDNGWKMNTKFMMEHYPHMINQNTCGGGSPFHYACRYRDVTLLQDFVKSGGSMDAEDNIGDSAKYKCCAKCNYCGSECNCEDKCRFLEGDSPSPDSCNYRPDHFWRLCKSYDISLIKERTKECCSRCKELKCQLNCESLAKCYHEKSICDLPIEYLRKFGKFLDSRIINISFLHCCTYNEKTCSEGAQYLTDISRQLSFKSRHWFDAEG